MPRWIFTLLLFMAGWCLLMLFALDPVQSGAWLQGVAGAHWLLHHPAEWAAFRELDPGLSSAPLFFLMQALFWAVAGWVGLAAFVALTGAGALTMAVGGPSVPRLWQFAAGVGFLVVAAPFLFAADYLLNTLWVFLALTIARRRPGWAWPVLMILAVVLANSGRGGGLFLAMAVVLIWPGQPPLYKLSGFIRIVPVFLLLLASTEPGRGLWPGGPAALSLEQISLTLSEWAALAAFVALLGAALTALAAAASDDCRPWRESGFLFLALTGCFLDAAFFVVAALCCICIISRLAASLHLERALRSGVLAGIFLLCSVPLWSQPTKSMERLGVRLALDGQLSREHFDPAHDQVLVNSSAALHLLLYHPGTASRQMAAMEAPAFVEQILLDPDLWRTSGADRQYDAVLLAGPPVGYEAFARRLARHPGWHADPVSPAGVTFRRSGSPRQADRVVEIEPWEDSPAAAVLLARLGQLLLFLEQRGMAREVIDQAVERGGPRSEEPWIAMAMWEAGREAWPETYQAAGRALRQNPRSMAALNLAVRSLMHMQHYHEAYPVSARLVLLNPSHPTLLYLHAAVCREAGARQEEIETLERLIDLALEAGQPVAGYRIFLGQAHAAAGHAAEALAIFRKVADDPDAAEGQRDYALEVLPRIEEQMP